MARIDDEQAAWYVIHTQTRKEAEVKMALPRQMLKIFLLMVIKPSRRRNRKVTLSVLLLSDYLFINDRLDTKIFH